MIKVLGVATVDSVMGSKYKTEVDANKSSSNRP